MPDEKVNYRTIFKKKIVLYSIGSFNIPMGVELKKIFIGVGSLGVAFILKFILLDRIVPVNNSLLVSIYYVVFALSGIAFFGNDYLFTEGKTVYRFIRDYLTYVFKIKVPHKLYYRDETPKEIQRPVKIIVK